ncbi:NADPH oxidase 4-like [Lytechinus pictus]|uniref:NADPH oxidase 4-like n=1 Tax=Lytechinus pictus TaxID=7653 RepID=UPI0030B9BFA7
MLWSLLNAAVFISVYYHYKYEPKYYYLREILGITLCVSRGSAALLNLNCAALILPVCKHLAARLRRSKLSSRSMRRWLDHYRFTHIMCAGCVCIATVIHCTAHSFNAVRFSSGFNSAFPDINVATFPGQNPCAMLLTTVAGITGSCMLCILLFIIVTSLPCFRRERHNVFWMSHHAFLLFYILLLCHPLGGILKEQCNTENHTPGCVYPDDPIPEPMSVKPDPNERVEYSRIIPHPEPSAVNSSLVCNEKPRFISHKSRTWRFLLVPASLYILDRVWRWFKSRRSVTIENLRFLPGDVIELRLHVEYFSALPGQYILINCPAISCIEWHPFTLTSCPTTSNPTFSLQMKVCGDWTDSFRQLLQYRLKATTGDNIYVNMPKILIDGPLGSASGDILRYRVSVCIAGGIGVTPFAATLNHLASLSCEELSKLKLARLYFIWTCRDESHFQWFSETINTLQHKLWEMNRPDFLNLRLHTSGSISKNDFSTGTQLCCCPVQGRPNIKEILSDITICNPKQDIGVFVCGPRKMTSRVHRLCNRLNKHKARLHFNQESFS